MSNQDTDPELDAAVLAADTQREQYILKRLFIRRVMAVLAFAQLIGGGAAIIILGLLFSGVATRIDHMGTFLSIYFGSLSAIIMAYWGVGTMMNGMGGYGGGYSGYSGMNQPFGGGYGGAIRPRLTKTGSQPASDEATGPKRNNDGQS